MPVISRDSIQILFTARDQVSGPLRTATNAITKLVTASGRAIKNLTLLGGRALLSGLRGIVSTLGSIAGFGGLLGGGGVAAGLGLLTTQGAAAAKELRDYSETLNITAQGLQRIGAVSRASFEDTAEGLKNLRERIGEAAEEDSGIRDAFNALGISTGELQQLANADLESVFFRFSDAIASADNNSVQLFRSMELLGEEGNRLLTTLSRGSADLQSEIERLDGLGLIVSDETLAKSNALNASLRRVQQIFRAVSLEVAGQLAPIVDGLITQFVGFVEANGGVGNVVRNAFNTARDSVERFLPLVLDGAQKLTDIAGLISSAFDFALSGIDKVVRGVKVLAAEYRVAVAEIQEFANVSAFGFRADEEAALEAATDAARLAAARLRQPEILIQTNLDENQLEGELGALRAELGNLQRQIDSGDLGRQKLARVTAEAEAIQRAIANVNDELDLFALGGEIGRIEIGPAAPTSETAPVTPPDNTNNDLIERLRLDREQSERDAIAASNRLKAQAAEEERLRNVATAQQAITSLRGQLDEELGIIQDFDNRVAALRSNASITGLSTEDTDGLVSQINAQRITALDEYYQRERDQIAQTAQAEADRIAEAGRLRTEEFNQRQTARDLNSLTDFDTTQGLEQGLEEIQRLFLSEVKEINLTPTLDLAAKQALITEAQQLKQEAESELVINARINTAQQGLDTAGSLLGSLGTIQQSGLDTTALQTRADEIKQVRADLLSSIQSSDDAEVASLERKLSSLQSIQSKEEQIARKRFESYKKTQKAIAVVSTISAAVQVFEETKGDLSLRIAGMTAALATGYAQVKAIDRQQFNGASVGSASGGSGSGSGAVTDAQLNDARNANSDPVQPSRTINLTVSRRARLDSEGIQELVDDLAEGIGDGTIDTNIRFVA